MKKVLRIISMALAILLIAEILPAQQLQMASNGKHRRKPHKHKNPMSETNRAFFMRLSRNAVQMPKSFEEPMVLIQHS